MNRTLILTSTCLLWLAACGDESAPNHPAPSPAPVAGPAGCEPGLREADFAASPMMGPAVGAGGALAVAGEVVVSSTYLQLRREALARFDELNGPITETLQKQPGLLALGFAGSPTCGTARTLSVWKDEAAMYAFVTSPAHAAAMGAIGELSRGNSIVTHWRTADVNAMSWGQALQALAAHKGPRY